MKTLFYLHILALLLTCSCAHGSVTDSSGTTALPKETQSLQSEFLAAIEWSDLDNWDAWLKLKEDPEIAQLMENQGYDSLISERFTVYVTSELGVPVSGEGVQLFYQEKFLWQAVTNNRGVVELFAPSSEEGYLQDRFTCFLPDQDYLKVIPYKGGTHHIMLDSISTSPQIIDIAWVMDISGFMANELRWVKTKFPEVIRRVQRQSPETSIRIGTVSHQIQKGVHMSSISPLSLNNAQGVLDVINDQDIIGEEASPEALNGLLTDSLYMLNWGATLDNHGYWQETNSSKIIFLLADVSSDYKHVGANIKLIKLAAARGIQIVPIIPYGASRETELFMRYAAIATNGRCLFMQEDTVLNQEAPVQSFEPYSPEYLQDLLIRIIADSL